MRMNRYRCILNRSIYKIRNFDFEEFWYNFWDKALIVAVWLLVIEVVAGFILLILTIIGV